MNRYRPHLYVIPEDDRERQIANGFIMNPHVDTRQVQVVQPAGGWSAVLQIFKAEYVKLLGQNQHAHVVMLIDFDGNPDTRRTEFNAAIPERLQPRVFVMGPRDNPETLHGLLGRPGYEVIGRTLADGCHDGSYGTWANDQLQHNEGERDRLASTVSPFLFR